MVSRCVGGFTGNPIFEALLVLLLLLWCHIILFNPKCFLERACRKIIFLFSGLRLGFFFGKFRVYPSLGLHTLDAACRPGERENEGDGRMNVEF